MKIEDMLEKLENLEREFFINYNPSFRFKPWRVCITKTSYLDDKVDVCGKNYLDVLDQACKALDKQER